MLKNLFSKTYIQVIFIVILSSLAFLPFLPGLGFYYNDWHLIAARTNGINPIRVFLSDRPQLGVIYTITQGIIGDRPFIWQMFALLLRLISGTGFFWFLQLIWNKNIRLNVILSILFVVYPGFLQQPMALTFTNHFIGYGAFIFSLVFTTLSINSESKKKQRIYGFFAAFLTFGYIMIYEYMVGLEIVRLFLIWFLISDKQIHIKELSRHIGKILKKWIPYLIGILLFVIWRFVVFHSSKDSTNVSLLIGQYFNNFLDMGARLFFETLKDLIEDLIMGWFVPLYQLWLPAKYVDLLISIIVAMLAVFLVLIFLKKSPKQDERNESETQKSSREIIWFGIIGLAGAIIPVVFSNRDVHFHSNFDRYTLHATFGIILFLGGLTKKYLSTKTMNSVLIGLLAFSLVSQNLNQAKFRDFWNLQKNVWWQYSWRIPLIKDGVFQSILLPDGSRFQGDTEIWAPVNLIYNDAPFKMRTTAEVLNEETALSILGGGKIYRNWRGVEYDRDFDKTLISSVPSTQSCLHIIDGDQMELSPYEDAVVRLVAAKSQINLIDTNAKLHKLPRNPFGKQPEESWCYYYQEASLARQKGDWSKIDQLQKTIDIQNLLPKDLSEWMPFLEGAYNNNDFVSSQEILDRIKKDSFTVESLCWGLEQSDGNYSLDSIFNEMRDDLCNKID